MGLVQYCWWDSPLWTSRDFFGPQVHRRAELREMSQHPPMSVITPLDHMDKVAFTSPSTCAAVTVGNLAFEQVIAIWPDKSAGGTGYYILI